MRFILLLVFFINSTVYAEEINNDELLKLYEHEVTLNETYLEKIKELENSLQNNKNLIAQVSIEKDNIINNLNEELKNISLENPKYLLKIEPSIYNVFIISIICLVLLKSMSIRKKH